MRGYVPPSKPPQQPEQPEPPKRSRWREVDPEVLAVAYLGKNATLLHTFIKSLKQTLEALIFTSYYISHIASSSFLQTPRNVSYNYHILASISLPVKKWPSRL